MPIVTSRQGQPLVYGRLQQAQLRVYKLTVMEISLLLSCRLFRFVALGASDDCPSYFHLDPAMHLDVLSHYRYVLPFVHQLHCCCLYLDCRINPMTGDIAGADPILTNLYQIYTKFLATQSWITLLWSRNHFLSCFVTLGISRIINQRILSRKLYSSSHNSIYSYMQRCICIFLHSSTR